MDRTHRKYTKKVNLSVLSDEQIREFFESVETDSDDELDSDDSVEDPDYVLDTIRPDRSTEEYIEECIVKINLAASEQPSISQAAASETRNISQVTISEQPSTSQAGASGQPTQAAVSQFRPEKRPRSPLPTIETTGPIGKPTAGGYTGQGKLIDKLNFNHSLIQIFFIGLDKVTTDSKELAKLLWRKRSMRLHVNEVAFRGNSSLPSDVKELHTPMNHFDYFFTSEIMNLIVEETNRCALQENINSKFGTTATEIKHYIGIVMYMSVYRYPNLESYWGKNAFAPIQKCMPLKRFVAIKRYLSFQDESLRVNKGQPGYDPLFRIRTLANLLNDRFDSIPKTARLCVDEQMCSTKTKHHLRQYMPNKPHKWGVKLFVLCDSNGFAYRFEIYNGAGDNVVLRGAPDLGATSNVVVRLSQTIPNFVHHILYFDNFYTSLPLLVYLRARGIYSLGTVRGNL